MRHSSLLCLIALAAMQATGVSATTIPADYEFASMYREIPFEMEPVHRPVIPAYEISITDFGGNSDGHTKNTEAFASAMKHLSEKGGGKLVVPAGIWYTGPIVFESNVELHLNSGALILFSSDREDYPLIDGYFEGNSAKRCQSPLTAIGKENVAITGFGTINGNGGHWRPVKKGKMTDSQWKERCKTGAVGAKGDVWYPSDRIREVSEDKSFLNKAYSGNNPADWEYVHDFLRPVMLSFSNCKNVLLEDVTFENSPAWNLHPILCENVILNRVTVRNPWFAQNGDGLDAESCKNVLVNRCSFDVGDDAICIKSGKDKEGRDRGVPCENVLISDCTVYHGHGGFVIGSEMSGGARNILIRNSTFIGTDCGLRFKSTRGRGGMVESVWIDGINMVDIAGDALIFDLYYATKAPMEMMPVTEETPSFRDIYITNTTCRGAKRAMFFNGLPEMPVNNISVKNSLFSADTGATVNFVNGLTFDNVIINHATGERITTRDVTNFTEK